MEWLLKMIHPVIKDCNTPEEARMKIIQWGKSQHPMAACMGLIAVDIMNAEYEVQCNQEIKEDKTKEI